MFEPYISNVTFLDLMGRFNLVPAEGIEPTAYTETM